MYYQHFITRFILRKHFLRRVRMRLASYYRKLTKDPLVDIIACMKQDDVKVVVDGGANIGFMTHVFLESFPKAKIYSIEPSPKVFASLAETYSENQRVVLINAGLADLVGTLNFHVNRNSGTSSFLTPTNYHIHSMAGGLDRNVEVPVINIEQLVSEHNIEHIDLMKLDVEGYELKVLQGAARLLAESRIDVIYAEVNLIASYEGQPLFHHIASFLEGFGYSIYNLDSFVGCETKIRQGVVGNTVFLSPEFRKQVTQRFGEDSCGWSLA